MVHGFRANKLVVDRDPLVLAFGDVEEDGTPRQSLLLTRDEDGPPTSRIHLELNEQINACSAGDIALIVLDDALLRIEFRSERLRSGAYDRLSEVKVRTIRVEFSTTVSALKELEAAFRDMTRDACEFRYVGRRLG